MIWSDLKSLFYQMILIWSQITIFVICPNSGYQNRYETMKTKNGWDYCRLMLPWMLVLLNCEMAQNWKYIKSIFGENDLFLFYNGPFFYSPPVPHKQVLIWCLQDILQCISRPKRQKENPPDYIYTYYKMRMSR